MRGRPTCLFLRQFAPLVAVTVLLGPAPAFAAGPAPDRAPAASGLQPDPAPGARTQTRPTAPAATTPTRPVYVAPARVVAPVVHQAAPTRPVAKRPAVAKPKRKPKPKHPVTHRAATFALPRIALPTLTQAARVREPRDLDAVLAGVALLLAAVTAGSGARLVSRWNSRAGAA